MLNSCKNNIALIKQRLSLDQIQPNILNLFVAAKIKVAIATTTYRPIIIQEDSSESY